jgi:hypothetical protein
MSASFEAKKNSQATMITAAFAAGLIMLMFFWKWTLPIIEPPIADTSIEVELNLPDEVVTKVLGGGGGGGNPVQASGPAGVAPHVPPAPGDEQDSKDIATDETDKASPTIIKPVNPKPTATKVVENTSVVKTPPKPVVENPAPKLKQGAQMGKTTSGTGKGGGVADNYDRSGGDGNGTGVGRGTGYGGGTGGGNGGGNGTGNGTGNGPRRISGNRVVINPKNMDAGENLRGKVFAEIKVSPDGIGTYVRATRGTTLTSSQAIDIIREWLRRNRFNKAADESLVVYEFNFLLGG